MKTMILSFIFISSVFSQPLKVLILEDGGTEDSVAAILNRAGGFDITMGGNYWQYGGTNINLYNLIILLNGVEWIYDMPDSVQTKIVNRVAAGAGLLTTEWVAYNSSFRFQIIKNILPVIYDNSYGYNIETYTRAVVHPISQGLPTSFTVPTNWSWSRVLRDTNPVKQALTVFTGSSSLNPVVVGVHVQGRVGHWSMAGHYNGNNIWDANTRQLLINLANYLGGLNLSIGNNSVPVKFGLYQNYPNPFNQATKISFDIPEERAVKLVIYDISGKELSVAVNQTLKAGSYEYTFDAGSLTSGIYFYRLEAGEFTETRKMILVK